MSKKQVVIHEGEWWTPSRLGLKFHGRLEITENRKFELTIFGHEPIISVNDHWKIIDCIHGCTIDDSGQEHFVTLYENGRTSRTGSHIFKEKYEASYLVYSDHKVWNDQFKNIPVKTLFLRPTYLDDWANKRGTRTTRKEGGFSYRIDYDHPKEVTLLENQSMRISLFIRAKISFTARDTGVFKQAAWINIDFKRRRALYKTTDFIEDIKLFFFFCLFTTIRFDQIEFRTKDGKDMKFALFDDSTSENILSEYARSSLPIPMSIIENDLPDMMSNWLSIRKKYRDSIDDYVRTWYFPDGHIRGIFLGIVFALEKYHKVRFPEAIKKSSISKKTKRLLDSISDQNTRGHFQSLTQRNQNYILLDRLEELAKKTPSFWKDQKGIKSRKRFLQRVVITRNRWAHREDDNKGVYTLAQISSVNQKLSIWYYILILMELGLTEKQALRRAKSTWIYRQSYDYLN